MRTITDVDRFPVRPADIDTAPGARNENPFRGLFVRKECEEAALVLINLWKTLGDWVPLSKEMLDGVLTASYDFPGLVYPIINTEAGPVPNEVVIEKGDDGLFRATERFIMRCHTRRG